jgi:phosphinothricin acetyltransferase
MLIRHADPASDAAGCAAVYAPFVNDTAITFEYDAPDGSEFAGRIARLSATHAFLVAEDEGTVVGFAYGSPHRDRTAYSWSTEVSVYVAASHHRRGVGRALYGTLFDLLERQGFRIVLAGIALPNDASVSIHESFGFELVGVYRGIGLKHGAWWDVGWYQLRLGPADTLPDAAPGMPVLLSDER